MGIGTRFPGAPLTFADLLGNRLQLYTGKRHHQSLGNGNPGVGISGILGLILVLAVSLFTAF